MSKQDLEKTLVIAELQKIFSLRKKLTNKVLVIVGINVNAYIDGDGYFLEWHEGDTSRKAIRETITIKEIVNMFVYLNYKNIEAVRKEIERTVGERAQ